MIRAGYRGYTRGSLNKDAYFEANMNGALANGLQVGVYFYSQALTPKEAKEDPKPYLDKAGWVRMGIIMAEAVLFTIGMEFIGFWITAMAGTFVFLWTLKGEKKVNLIVAILFSVGLASLGYFGFTRGFVIPLPKGVLWESLGIPMP